MIYATAVIATLTGCVLLVAGWNGTDRMWRAGFALALAGVLVGLWWLGASA